MAGARSTDAARRPPVGRDGRQGAAPVDAGARAAQRCSSATTRSPFALIGRWAGGGALIGSEPVAVAGADDDPFALLDEQPAVAADAPPGVRVGGGWFGYLGYELGRRVEPVGAGPPPAAPLPAVRARVLRPPAAPRRATGAGGSRRCGRQPARRGRCASGSTRCERRRAPRRRDRAAFAHRARGVARPSAGRARPRRRGVPRERIHAGDLFQANLCAAARGAPARARRSICSPARRGAADRPCGVPRPARGARSSACRPSCSSSAAGGVVRSAPIKGTRPRPADAATAAAQRGRAGRSAKDRAENVMIVDLVRNDLGRVCAPGSIRVDALRAGARARRRVAPGLGGRRDAARRASATASWCGRRSRPGRSPARRRSPRMEVIAELESHRPRGSTPARSASPARSPGSSSASRSARFEVRGERVWLGVGGGIVADSDPVGRGGRVRGQGRARCSRRSAVARRRATSPAPRRPARPGVARAATGAAPRPGRRRLRDAADRRLGGRWRSRHIGAPARSVARAVCRELPRRSGRRAAGGRRRMRELGATARRLPSRSGRRRAFEVTPLAPPTDPVRLRPAIVPGGLGAHKWVDRRLLERADGCSATAEPLLCDLDGLRARGRARERVHRRAGGRRLTTPPRRAHPARRHARACACARARARLRGGHRADPPGPARRRAGGIRHRSTRRRRAGAAGRAPGQRGCGDGGTGAGAPGRCQSPFGQTCTSRRIGEY